MIKEIAEIIRGFLKEKEIPTEDKLLKIHGHITPHVIVPLRLEHPTHFDAMPFGVKKELEKDLYERVATYMEENKFSSTVYFENYISFWGETDVNVYIKNIQTI